MIESLKARLGGRGRAGPAEAPLGEVKLRAIDYAFEQGGASTVGDLGGVWAVDGGYTLYAIDRHGAGRGVICDDDFTEPLLDRDREDDRLELVRGNFGRPETAAAVGEVDAILLFDVLLHQVAPDWDDILALYAPRTHAFVLAGPWWNGDEGVRLVDLGREEYLASVPLPDFHAEIWEKLDEHNPKRDRPWRDCHDIWQWGITEAELTARMEALGFELSHREHNGPWMGLDRFDDIGFVYTRRDG